MQSKIVQSVKIQTTKMRFSVLMTIACLCVFFEGGGAQLTISDKKCGDRRCTLNQYCDSFSKICAPCANICDPDTHNLDVHKCEKECQDYLHDARYVRLGGSISNSGAEDLRVLVQNLQVKVTVLLTLVCILIISLIFVLCFQIWRWKKNNKVTLKTLHTKIFHKKSDNNANNAPSNGVAMNAQTSAKPDLRLDMPTPATQSDHSPVTMTTAISRIPAEDSIDYAYDNPVMSNTSNQSRIGHVSA